MARSDVGATLTAQHRSAQLQVRAQALRDYMTLWPLWTGDESSFARLVSATVPLIRAHHRVSSALAASYYDSFRRAEGIAGEATPRLAPTVALGRVETSLYVTGRVMTGKAIAAGQSPQAAMQTALVRTSGAVSRHVLTGGRDTLVLSTGADRRSAGWHRVTGGEACDFCTMLASRGAVYSDDTADFQAHDHCSCMAEPQYRA